MDTSKPSATRAWLVRRDVYRLVATGVVITHTWALWNLFAAMTGIVMRMSPADVVGMTAYVLLAAAVEGIVLALAVLPLLWLVYRVRPRYDSAVTGFLLLVALSLSAMLVHWLDSAPGALLVGSERSGLASRLVPALLGTAFVSAAGVAGIVVAGRSATIGGALSALGERLAVLGALYLGFDALALTIVLARNLWA